MREGIDLLLVARRSSARQLAGAFAGAIVLASLASSEPSHAQPAKPAQSTSAQDSAVAEARARFEEGIKLAEAGDHEGARLKFNQAWALHKSPVILFNLARSEELSNRPVEALEHYRQFVKAPPDPKVTAAQRSRADEIIAELAKTVGQIEVQAPPGARITVDGRAIDPGNADPVPVSPGKHVVEAIADGRVKSVTVECAAGTVTKATLIEPRASGAAVPPKEDKPNSVEAPKDEAPGFWTTGRVVGLGMVAGGLGALGAGVAFGFSASSAERDAANIRVGFSDPRSACLDQANEAQCSKLTAAVDKQNTHGDLSTGLLIGGGVLTLGGAVLFLVASPKSSESTRGGPRIVPVTTGRETGVAVLGSF